MEAETKNKKLFSEGSKVDDWWIDLYKRNDYFERVQEKLTEY